MQRQQPRKEEAGLVPESLFLSPIAAWLAGATASPAPPPAPPLSGEFNSLPAGSLTLLCSEARNYKIYRKKNDMALQLHTGASPAAPQSRPPGSARAAGALGLAEPGLRTCCRAAQRGGIPEN